jgi:N4-gp56 family major capsid protein
MLVQITDVVEDLAMPPVLQDAAVQVGENVGRTIEAITWGVLRGGTNVAYTNGTQRTDVNTPITLAKLRAATRTLDQNKAMHVTSVVEPGPDIGTRSVEAGWVAVCHTNLKSDIRNLPGFLPVSDYGHRRTIHEREFGTVEEIRFVTSPDLDAFEDGGGAAGSMVSTTGTSADVYPIVIFGKEAYGTVPLRGEGAISPHIIPPGKIDKSDPLGQRGFVGVKFYYTALRLNESWMVRIETAATSL